MIRLGVNIDHVATLRNARGDSSPDPIEIAKIALNSGADGITAHLREDRRHIRDADMTKLRALPAPLNFEMAATEEMVKIACDLKPHACCLVPEKRQEVTTEGGLNLFHKTEDLKEKILRLKNAGIRVSLFIDPDIRQVEQAVILGAPVIELHTGSYAHGEEGSLRALEKASDYAAEHGLELHAGHGLTYANVKPITKLKNIKELNIGHFLIAQALFDGISHSISTMKSLLK